MFESNQFFRLVVKGRDHLNSHQKETAEASYCFSEDDFFTLRSLLKNFSGLRLGKLFTSLEPETIVELAYKAGKLDPGYYPPNFLTYYAIDCPVELNPDEILKILLGHKNVEMAYVETMPVRPPSIVEAGHSSVIHQGYLRSAPTGINALYAWDIEGGDGNEVKFIDIEQGWRQDQENFTVGTFPFTGLNFPVFQDHGDAVMGVILMPHHSSDGIGIAPNANGCAISQWRDDGSFNTADAIMYAVSQLEWGDVIILEAQIFDSPGSGSLFPVEIQDAVFDTIRLATALGITVIEAAGNGTNCAGAGNDLDNYVNKNGRKTLNPLSADFKDSGAILVAGGSDKMPHTRIRHSNFGSRVDCFAWGERVSTAGSHLGSADTAIQAYRKKISGTSSATAIVAGAAILVQSIMESYHNVRLGSKQMREILNNELLGTPSANGRKIDRIGVMPDLKKITDYILNADNGLKSD